MSSSPDLGNLSSPKGVSFKDVDDHGMIAESNSGVRLEIGGHGFIEFPRSGAAESRGHRHRHQVFPERHADLQVERRQIPVSRPRQFNDTAKPTELIFPKDDKLIGSFGNDILEGFKGSDQIDGKAGNDTLYGDGGRDRLDGGDGVDTLNGGKGRDTYVFKIDPTVTGSA